MRTLTCVSCFLVLGCFEVPATGVVAQDAERVTSGPDAELPPDLGTRKAGHDWAAFLGPTGDGVSAEKGLVLPWPKDGPKVVWSRKVQEGYALPAISRGRCFVFDRIRTRDRLTCLNAETGESLWTYEYPSQYEDRYGYSNGPRCYPVVDRDRVYTYGAQGLLHCVRAADGKLVWKTDTFKEFGVIPNYFGVGSTPVIEEDLLLVQVGGSPAGSDEESFANLKGNGTGLVAFDKYTGKVKYKATDELASYAVPVLATIDKRRWCFLFARSGLIGLDPATGKADFRFPWRARELESVNASNPVVVGDKVFISETYGPGGALLEVKPGGYKEVWTDARKREADKSMQCHWNTPIHVDGYLYGSSGRHEHTAELRCIELATGKVMWSEPGLSRCSLLLVEGHFVCQAETGTLHVLKVNPKKFDEVSRVNLSDGASGEAAKLVKEPAWGAPVLSHGLLYVRGRDRLVCLEVIPEKK